MELELQIELGNKTQNARYASITLGGVTVFSELVYDNEIASAEENVLKLFASRLRRLLEEA